MTPTVASPSAADENSASGSAITTVHPHIIQSHILNRLDGPALACAASVSSQLRLLCTEELLWKNICTATWPSLEDPLARTVISTFPAGHRSIFSDSFPSLHHSSSALPNNQDRPSTPLLEQFISAVDIYYQGKPVVSKVRRTETQKGWFLCSPLWVDLLDPNEMVPTPLKFAREEEEWLKHLEENLSLSWIMIDPTRKRAANLSSRRPMSVQRHWLTRDLELLYAVVMAADDLPQSRELVQCTIKVTCCGKVGGEMHVREVSLSIEDMEGRHVTGRESMVILQRAMENGKRKKVNAEEAKHSFEEFCSMKRERKERKLRREKGLDMIVMVVAVTIFTVLAWFMWFCV